LWRLTKWRRNTKVVQHGHVVYAERPPEKHEHTQNRREPNQVDSSGIDSYFKGNAPKTLIRARRGDWLLKG
jgi:hypothetical protein